MTIGAFAILMDKDGRVLWTRRKDRDVWNLPGGKVEAGETPWDAVVREVQEEIGVQVRVDELRAVNMSKDGKGLTMTFFCSIVSGEPTLSDEVCQVEYFHLQDIPDNVSPNQFQRMIDILNSEQTVFSVHRHPRTFGLFDAGELEEYVRELKKTLLS